MRAFLFTDSYLKIQMIHVLVFKKILLYVETVHLYTANTDMQLRYLLFQLVEA